MRLTQHIFGICERTGDGYFEEPLNVLSNLFFIWAAVAVFSYYRSLPELKRKKFYDVPILTGLIAIIGILSMVFHTYPTPYTEAFDTIPIVAFIIIYFFSAMFRIAKCNIYQALICFVAFAGFTHISVTQFPHAFNDSIGYLSSMVALIAIAFYLNMKRRGSARAFMFIALVGIVSLFFRSIDNAVCQAMPIGTHFLWHSLNAYLLYMLMIQLVRNVNRRGYLIRKARAQKLEQSKTAALKPLSKVELKRGRS